MANVWSHAKQWIHPFPAYSNLVLSHDEQRSISISRHWARSLVFRWYMARMIPHLGVNSSKLLKFINLLLSRCNVPVNIKNDFIFCNPYITKLGLMSRFFMHWEAKHLLTYDIIRYKIYPVYIILQGRVSVRISLCEMLNSKFKSQKSKVRYSP